MDSDKAGGGGYMSKYCLRLVMEESVFELAFFLSCSFVIVQSPYTTAGLNSSHTVDPASAHFELMAAQMTMVYLVSYACS